VSTESDSRPADVARLYRRLGIADKRRLSSAVGEVEAMFDPNRRQAILRELREELGPDFDPPRFASGIADSWEIVSACVQLGGVRELVQALALIGGETQAWQRLSHLVERMFPPTVLAVAERRRLEAFLREASAELVRAALEAAGFTAFVDLGLESGRDRDHILARVETTCAVQGDSSSMWVFLESVARRLPDPLLPGFQLAIDEAAGTLGDDEYATVCRVRTELGVPPVERHTTPLRESRTTETVDLPESDDKVQFTADMTSGDGDVDARTVATNLPTPRAASPAVWGGVPPRNRYFAGRFDVLDEIRRTLRRSARAAVLPQTLHGLGGVGKTQVAIEFAHRFKSDYDLVWWVPAEDELSIRRSLVSMARKLGLAQADDAQLVIESALDELRLGRLYARWLVVFDNAAEPEVVRPYLPTGSGHILITSRNRSWITASSVIEVDVFQPDESVEFLTRRWAGLTDEEAAQLAERLGHLPLALDQAVAVHEQTGMPLSEYLRNFDASPVRLLGETIPTDYPVSVAKTWQLAFERLAANSPAAAQLLQLCAFLSSHPIAVPMIHDGRAASLPSPLKQALQEDLMYRKAVADIGKYALAQIDPGRDFITVHTLVRTVLQHSLPEAQQETFSRMAQDVLAHANPGTPDRAETWTRHARIAPHVRSAAVVHSDDPHVRQVVMDQIRYHFAIGDFKESRDLARLAVADWTERLGSDDLMTLRAKFHLGNALRVLGEYAEAKQLTEETFHQFESTYGSEHEYTLQVANSVTADLRLVGEVERSRLMDEQNLARHRAVLGNDDRSTLLAANNLALDYRLLGLFERARELDEDVLRRRDQRGPAGIDPETLLTINNLARDLHGLGRYEDALKVQLDRLAVFEEQLGLNHRLILLARRNLAILWRKTGEYHRALQAAESGLEATLNQYGPRHEHSLGMATTLFNTMRVCGDVVGARNLADATIETYRDRFGIKHPATLACAIDLASVYRAQSLIGEADSLDHETFATLREVFGDDHPYTLCCAANITNNLAAMGRHAEARTLSQDVFDRSQRLRGPSHPMTLACAANLAIDMAAVGEHAAALELRGQVLQGLQLWLGPEHPQTVSVERGRRTEADVEIPPL
jgi:tetratricopeptide (TPR) repeat protein